MGFAILLGNNLRLNIKDFTNATVEVIIHASPCAKLWWGIELFAKFEQIRKKNIPRIRKDALLVRTCHFGLGGKKGEIVVIGMGLYSVVYQTCHQKIFVRTGRGKEQH
ncbi:hypothetical protein ACJX0J_007585 [Zea mays]